MARPASQIRESMAKTLAEADPSADLAKGTFFDLMVAPIVPEVAEIEQAVEDSRVLASLQMDKVATEAEINAVGRTFAIPPINGKAAVGRQTFYVNSRPTSDIVIKRGTLVGTIDTSKVYQVVEQVTMLASNIDAYYNAARRRYEITAAMEAIAIGDDHNLPAFRITRFLTRVDGVDGTENREATSGGTSRQSVSEHLARIRAKFTGMNPDSGGGVRTKIFEYAPSEVNDLSLVFPKDRKIFRRDTGRPAIDVYVLGTNQQSHFQRYVSSTGGETVIYLEKTPAVAVSLVQIDGQTSTGYAFVADSSIANAQSARAMDAIVLSTPLTAGQIVEITFTYEKLVRDLQDNLFNSSDGSFGTDVLIRMPVELPVAIEVDVTVLSSFDVNRTTDYVRAAIFDYVETSEFVTELTPEALVQRIKDSVAGISALRLLRFAPTSGAVLPVQTLTLEKNQIPSVDQSVLYIRTHQ